MQVTQRMMTPAARTRRTAKAEDDQKVVERSRAPDVAPMIAPRSSSVAMNAAGGRAAPMRHAAVAGYRSALGAVSVD